MMLWCFEDVLTLCPLQHIFRKMCWWSSTLLSPAPLDAAHNYSVSPPTCDLLWTSGGDTSPRWDTSTPGERRREVWNQICSGKEMVSRFLSIIFPIFPNFFKKKSLAGGRLVAEEQEHAAGSARSGWARPTHAHAKARIKNTGISIDRDETERKAFPGKQEKNVSFSSSYKKKHHIAATLRVLLVGHATG